MARVPLKKSYKQRQREIEETPEFVEEQLWSLSDWMEANWRPVVGVLATVVVIWAGMGVYQEMAQSSHQDAAKASEAAFESMARPVYVAPEGLTGEDPNRPFGEVFGSETARADAVLSAAKAGGTDPFAALLAGAAKGRKGDWAGQLSAVDAAKKAFTAPAMQQALEQQRATALTHLGKNAEAIKAWSTVAAQAKTPMAKAMAQLHIGDLYNPSAKSGVADATKAKAAYSAAMKALAVNGKAPKEGAEAFYYTDAKLKSAQL